MSKDEMKPILFLDVDGPLNPYAAKPHQRPEGYETHHFFQGAGSAWGKRGLRVWLNPRHGEQLLALPFELVWGTTWEEEANKYIGPNIGLPELPVAHLSSSPSKVADLVRYADGHPFAWVDDEIMLEDDAYAAANHSAPHLLRYISPRLGLRDDDFTALREWAVSNDLG